MTLYRCPSCRGTYHRPPLYRGACPLCDSTQPPKVEIP